MSKREIMEQEIADIWSEISLMAQLPFTTEGYELWCWLNRYAPGEPGSRIGYVRALQNKIKKLKENQ
jgi:hypothetical protein